MILCASFVSFVALWWISFCFSEAKRTVYHHKGTKSTKNAQRRFSLSGVTYTSHERFSVIDYRAIWLHCPDAIAKTVPALVMKNSLKQHIGQRVQEEVVPV